MNLYFAYFQTAFVRQKTPHPKELKAKAHKLFGNKKPLENQDSLDNNGDNQNGDHIVSSQGADIGAFEKYDTKNMPGLGMSGIFESMIRQNKIVQENI